MLKNNDFNGQNQFHEGKIKLQNFEKLIGEVIVSLKQNTEQFLQQSDKS